MSMIVALARELTARVAAAQAVVRAAAVHRDRIMGLFSCSLPGDRRSNTPRPEGRLTHAVIEVVAVLSARTTATLLVARAPNKRTSNCSRVSFFAAECDPRTHQTDRHSRRSPRMDLRGESIAFPAFTPRR